MALLGSGSFFLRINMLQGFSQSIGLALVALGRHLGKVWGTRSLRKAPLLKGPSSEAPLKKQQTKKMVSRLCENFARFVFAIIVFPRILRNSRDL